MVSFQNYSLKHCQLGDLWVPSLTHQRPFQHHMRMGTSVNQIHDPWHWNQQIFWQILPSGLWCVHLYLCADVALTDWVFWRGKYAKFSLDICFAKSVSFVWNDLTSKYKSWANTPFPRSSLLSSFIFCIISVANAKSDIHSVFCALAKKSQTISFFSKNMTISSLSSQTLFNTFPKLSHLTLVWYSTSEKSNLCLARNPETVCDLVLLI